MQKKTCRSFLKSTGITALAGVTALATVLGGCGGAASVATAASTSQAASSSESAPADSTKAEGTAAADLPEVNLVYYFVGTPQADLDTVSAEINKITKEKINATVELKLIDWGSYDSKMALVMSSGEEYDLCFTSSWTNNYYQNVAKGAFVDMTDLLDQYAPVTKATSPQRFWDSVTVNGHIYSAVNFQQSAAGFGFRVQQELADKYNFDWKAAKSLEDVEPFLAQIKASEPNLIPFGYNKILDPFTKGPIVWGFDAIGDITTPGWVYMDDSELKVVNQYDTPEFAKYSALMRDWYQKGYIRPDAATLSDVTSDQKAAKYALEYEQIDISTEDFEKAGLTYDGRMMSVNSVKSYDHKFIEPVLTNEKASATMTAISTTSKNPERAMMLIELLNTDKDLYNLFCYGIEGKHYTKLSDWGIEVNADAGYAPWTSWEFGNMANAYVSTAGWPAGSDKARDDGLPIATGLWYDLNQNVQGSPLLGFVFDYEPVKSEIANCQAVLDELYTSISCGSVDPATYIPQLNEQLKAAGMDHILEEKQAQLDAWKASK